MTRSVKKVPGYTDRNPWAKRYANKRVRAVATRALRNHLVTYDSFYDPTLELNHKMYKRYTCSYDICDYKFLYWSPLEIKGNIEEQLPYHYRTYGEYLEGLGISDMEDHSAWWRGQDKREGQRKAKLCGK